MKLHEALQKIVSQFGTEVLQEERLVNQLADYKAFDDYPAMRLVMKALTEGGYAKDLLDPAISGKRAYTSRAKRAKKSLAADRKFRQEFADYAVDCVSFAVGRISSVTEPSDHGFDPSDPSAKGAPANNQDGSGQSVERNDDEASELYKKSAKQRDAVARSKQSQRKRRRRQHSPERAPASAAGNEWFRYIIINAVSDVLLLGAFSLGLKIGCFALVIFIAIVLAADWIYDRDSVFPNLAILVLGTLAGLVLGFVLGLVFGGMTSCMLIAALILGVAAILFDRVIFQSV